MTRAATVGIAALVAATGFAVSASATFRTANIIAKVGDEVAPGITISALNQAFVAGNGKVGFTGNLTGGPTGESFVWFDTGIIWRNSDAADDTLSGAEGTMGVGDSGQFIYSPSVNSEDAAWGHAGLVIRGTEPDPAQPAKFVTFASRPQMTADGTGYVVTGRSTTQGGSTTERVLYRHNGGTSFTPVVSGGDVVSGLTVAPAGINFNYSISDNNANSMTILTLTGVPTTSDTIISRNGVALMREGDPTGQGDNWQNWRMVGINNNGDSLVVGDTNATADDFIAYNGSISVKQGQSVGGLTLGTTVDAAAINNLGQAIFIWDITSGTDEALFFGNANNLAGASVLLRTGDEIDINGDNIADVTLTDFEASATITQALDFAADGFIYLEVGLTPIGGGTEVNSIIKIAVPTPGAFALFGLAGLTGLRRRRN